MSDESCVFRDDFLNAVTIFDLLAVIVSHLRANFTKEYIVRAIRAYLEFQKDAERINMRVYVTR